MLAGMAADPSTAVTTTARVDARVVASLEDVAGVQLQRFGSNNGDRLVHLGAFPAYTGVRIGVHYLASAQGGGLVLGGLVAASTTGVSRPLEAERTTYASFGPRVGWAFGMGRTLGAWVRVGPTLLLLKEGTQGGSKQWLDLSLEAQLAWTFTPRVALLFGPSASLGLFAKRNERHQAFGFLLGLGVML